MKERREGREGRGLNELKALDQQLHHFSISFTAEVTIREVQPSSCATLGAAMARVWSDLCHCARPVNKESVTRLDGSCRAGRDAKCVLRRHTHTHTQRERELI